MVRVVSGGGISSNKLVTSKGGQKVEPKATRVEPEAAALIGRAVDFKNQPAWTGSGPGYMPQPCGPTGVPGKYNPAKAGPGSLRTVMPSGSQSLYGSTRAGEPNRAPDLPATRTVGRDILSAYGPEKGKR